ncbi:hypothetical protein AGLY_002626 [Aphis glycines]|uniref:Uncharacterized protein n=1 Tax=Aphis glycines TaxID=307491 RepID=A0A6G0U0U5_APHGL|nr:hypothetical protein AGLY_002626 [Aphis glycines]
MLRVFSIASWRKTYGKLSVVFLIHSYKHNKFYDFSTSKLVANFRDFDRFPIIRTTRKEPCIKFSSFFGHLNRKLDLRKKFSFFCHFFFVFLDFYENCWKFLLFTYIMHQGYSISHRKPSPKFDIEALFRLVTLYTDIKTIKTNTHYCKINTFITSFRIKISISTKKIYYNERVRRSNFAGKRLAFFEDQLSGYSVGHT